MDKNVLSEFISKTHDLRNEVKSLVEKYNEMGKETFGSNWINCSYEEYLRVMFETEELIPFKGDPTELSYHINDLHYNFSSDCDDYFEGRLDKVNVVEVVVRGNSPIHEGERRYV